MVRLWTLWTGDHPRVGGEKPFTRFSDIAREGSPPRGRGKGYNTLSAIQQGRITPAWAGKSHFLIVRVVQP